MGWIKGRQKELFFVLGIIVIFMSIVPNLILGEHAIFTYHDQLDGEVIAYILQAKHLFENGNLPEFMCGMPKTALTMPAPIFVLLFLGGEYVSALVIMLLLGRLTGFVGMYLLSKSCTDNAGVSFVVGVLYGLLPFLPVYGLSELGIPMLFWCAMQLKQQKNRVISYLYIIIYALASSLVLVGFALLGLGVVWLVGEWIARKRRSKKDSGLFPVCMSVCLLLLVYLLMNRDLLVQILGNGESVVSHKTGYTLVAKAFGPTFWEYMLYGLQHALPLHHIAVPAGLAAVAISLLFAVVKQTGSMKERIESIFAEDSVLKNALKYMLLCLVCNVFLCAMAAFWNSPALLGVRDKIGALGAFQVERVLWVAPCLWYLLLACALVAVGRLTKGAVKNTEKMLAVVITGGLALAVAVTGVQILLSGDIKSNIQKLRNPEYGILSFHDYYAIGVMEQVEEFLRDTTGLEQHEYRVASLGIDPAASLYHGFYSVDGYSNNYDLEYKHIFREVIAPELEKSEYLTQYFDEWGNRCYLVSAECPGYYTIEKDGFYFQNYELNVAALKQLGCEFVLSAAYIANGEQQGLRLLNENPFETEDSYYCIYVYQIED